MDWGQGCHGGHHETNIHRALFVAVLPGFDFRRSSRELHTRLFGRLMAASLDFFESTPRGRILGHFSKDIDAVDALLPQYLLDFLQENALLGWGEGN